MTLTANDITGATGPKGSARNPDTKKISPSAIENVLDGVVLANPPDKEFFIGPQPGPDAILEGILDRELVVRQALNMNSRLPQTRVRQFTDAMFNNGFAFDEVKKMATMNHSSQMVQSCLNIFDCVGILNPTAEDVSCLAAVAGAILNHIMNVHKDSHEIKLYDMKTPYIAWQVKEELVRFLASNPKEVDVGSGFDNTRQCKELYANFAATDNVLWNHNIWQAAVRGCEAFEGKPLTKDMVDSVVPMFWQYDTTITMRGREWETFNVNGQQYQIVGFVIMPTKEDFIEAQIPEDLVENVKPREAEGDFLIELKNSKEAREMVDHFREHGLRFAKRGISIALVFMPYEVKNSPLIKFLVPTFEGETIHGILHSMIFAGVEFLNLDYVAKDNAEVKLREIKHSNRELFKKVRKGRVNIPPIKIINLRRSERRARTERDEREGRKYNCHFLVEAHWRGIVRKSTGMKEVIRVASYVKGNMDKPFKPPRAKVFKAVR